jgi:hypothetical protein
MTEIYVKLRKFFDVNKTGANNIYLGQNTWRRIKAEHGEKIDIGGIEPSRPRLLGLNVYTVDAEEHIALS